MKHIGQGDFHNTFACFLISNLFLDFAYAWWGKFLRIVRMSHQNKAFTSIEKELLFYLVFFRNATWLSLLLYWPIHWCKRLISWYWQKILFHTDSLSFNISLDGKVTIYFQKKRLGKESLTLIDTCS